MSEGFSRERFVEKVQGLIAKAESTTQEEAEAAMGLARRLMDKYGISTADVEALKADTAAAGDKAYTKGQAEGCRKSQGFDRWEQTLMSAVGELTDTVPLIHRAQGRGSHARLSFVGDSMDVAIAVATFTLLRKSVYYLGKQRIGAGWNFEHRSFHLGFASAIYDRAVEAKRASAAQFDGTADAETFALVKASKGDWLSRILAEMGVVTRKRRSSSGQFSSDSYRQGQQEGRRADLAVTNKLG